MAEEKFDASLYPVRYGIRVYMFDDKTNNLPTLNDNGNDDVSSYVVMRSPITKTASMATITLSLKYNYYASLEEYTRQNQFQLCEVCVYIVPNQNTVESHNPPIVDHVGCKQYMILNVKALEEVNIQAPYIMTNLVLVHPVLYYMQLVNGYNKILEDLTVYDALTEFRDYCDKTFGTGCFQWEEIGKDYKLNDFRYEQILTRQRTDLMIPTMLISNYKMWDTFGYFFFDDFRFDSQANRDITGFLVNLGDLEQFPTKNVYPKNGMSDVAVSNKQIKSDSVVDHFNVLYQKNPSVIVKGSDRQFAFKKTSGERRAPKIETMSWDGKYDDTRTAKVIQTKFNDGEVSPNEDTILYSPDDPEKSLKRFNEVSKQVRNKIRCIQTYYMHDCHLDFIQFGYRYNLSPYNLDGYLYVPINLCNMFVRESGPVPIMVHNMKYQVLQYSDPNGGE